jgi:hypothetical protein
VRSHQSVYGAVVEVSHANASLTLSIAGRLRFFTLIYWGTPGPPAGLFDGRPKGQHAEGSRITCVVFLSALRHPSAVDAGVADWHQIDFEQKINSSADPKA